ncbi:MAG: hypothetical protein R3C03_02370 [Pirellulaceae bacterium]
MLITNKERNILKVLSDSSNTTTLAIFNEKGKELKADDTYNNYEFLSNISDDRHSVTLPASASDLPSDSDKELGVKGKVFLLVGSSPKSEEVSITLTPDTELKIAGVDVKVTAIDDDFLMNPCSW